ncbi:MAG: hypothetical protein KDD82_23190 [Planctomycetes bacterium]|nr:hypothetical protein [Planctomycetota bacterium]
MKRLTLSLLFLLCATLGVAQELNDADLPFKDENGVKTPLFMHGETFSNGTGGGWARDDVEIEAAMTVEGVSGEELYRELIDRDQRGFKKVRRSSSVEGLSLGFNLDEIPWNSDGHGVREGRVPGQDARTVTPYVWLTIESDKFPIDPERGRRRLELGTDVMDDIYYDTNDFLLNAQNMTVRARKRWDSATEMRRLLIALKRERGVDSFGIKRAAKTDVREDMPSPDAITGLHEAVQRGHDSWGDRPAVPLQRTYTVLRDLGLLRSSPTYTNVLALRPKAFLRSIRSRYHLNEVNVRRLDEVRELAAQRLQAIVAMAREARLDGAVTPEHLAAVEAFEAKAAAYLSGALVAEKARAELEALGLQVVDASAIQDLLPGTSGPGSSSSLADLAEREPVLLQRKAVAHAVHDALHELAGDLDDGTGESLRRVITRSIERTDEQEDHIEYFTLYARAQNPDLLKIRTMDRFVELHEGMLGDAAALAAYNAYGEQQRAAGERDFRRFEPLDQAAFDALRFLLRNEQVRIWLRQLEAGGSCALGQWFDEAREFYVPASSRSTGNFLIDTMDFAAMYPADVFGDLPQAEQTAAVDLNVSPYRERLIGARLVNEVQIELTNGGAYTDRLKQLKSLIALPRGFMRWASATGQAASEAEYAALFSELSALDDEALQTAITPLNVYLEEQGSPVDQFTADEFREWIDPARLTLEIRDDAAYSEPEIEAALAGASFVFGQYRDILTFVAKLKEEQVLDVLEDAGPDLAWVPAEASKGRIAIGLVKDSEPDPGTGGGGGGLIGGLTDVHDFDKAPTLSAAKPAAGSVVTQIDDFYRVELAAGETATFTLRFDSANDLDLQLLDQARDGVDVSQGVEDSETITYTAGSQPEVMVLRVYGYSGAAGDYTLARE